MSDRSDMNAVIRRAMACPHGWQKVGTNSTGHPVYSLPGGKRVSGSWSPGDVNAARNVATALAKACGCDSFWDRAGVGRRSRKAPRTTGFSLEASARESRRWHERNADADELPRRHAELVAELSRLHPRRDAAKCAALAMQVVAIRERMDAAHIPYDQ